MTASDRILPDATSTKTMCTVLGEEVGDAPGAGEGLVVGAGEADPSGGTTRSAAIVLPSGDHQKLTTAPSSRVRTLPDSGSRSRSGPTGTEYADWPGSLGPIEATVSPLGSKPTAAVPKTGIERRVDSPRPATTTFASSP